MKQREALDLPLRDLLELFRRCEDFIALIRRGRARGGKYGTAEAVVKAAADLEVEMERLRAKVRDG
jgi:hypothetical protein